MANKNILGRLKQDLARSPKKTAVLLIGTGVALYCWAPLLIGWIPNKPEKKEADIADEKRSPSVVAVVVPEAPSKDVTIDWTDLVRWRGEDPRTKTVIQEAITNPFPSRIQERFMTEPDEEAPPSRQTVRVRYTPEDYELTLGSVIIGPQRKTAQISGKTYHLNDLIDTASLNREGSSLNDEAVGRPNNPRFILTEIGSEHVVLMRNEETFVLELHRASSGRGRMTIE